LYLHVITEEAYWPRLPAYRQIPDITQSWCAWYADHPSYKTGVLHSTT